jgi:superfamily I DNA and/or RNA helicase
LTDTASLKAVGWTEHLIVLLKNVDDMEKSVLARIKATKNKRNEAEVCLETRLSGTKIHLVNEFRLTKTNYRKDTKWEVVELFSLVTAVREYQSLVSLTTIPLGRDVLKPSFMQHSNAYAMMDNIAVEKLRNSLGLNRPQAEAVYKATSQESGFALIEGPPGTGKTKTILGLIGAHQKTVHIIPMPHSINQPKKSIHFATSVKDIQNHSNSTNNKRRLLICAPSNAAIDEITRRLMNGILNTKGEIYQPKIVRVGTVAANDSTRSVSLDLLVENALNADSAVRNDSEKVQMGTQKIDNFEDQIKKLIEERKVVDIEEKAQGETADKFVFRSKISIITSKIHDLKRLKNEERMIRTKFHSNLDISKSKLRVKIVSEADIV